MASGVNGISKICTISKVQHKAETGRIGRELPPEPDALAEEIIENLESGRASYAAWLWD